MPRYEPTPAEQEALLPQAQPQPARYQQLNVDSAPQTQHRAPRSPFVCAGCTRGFTIPDRLKVIFPSRKAITGYVSGFLFALGWWIFIDGAVYNAYKAQPDGHWQTLAVEDWIPGILSTLALLIVNMIDRESLSADDSAYVGTHVAMKARGFAFFGITMALGSLGGALAILSLKYIMPGLEGDAMYLVSSIDVGTMYHTSKLFDFHFIHVLVVWTQYC
jgi:hypothetical protein